MSKLFLESVGVVAEGIGVRLDGTRTLQEFGLADKEFEVAGRLVRPGTVTGQWYRWQGLRDGEAVIEVEALWTIGKRYPEHWPNAPEGWSAIITGEPPMQATFSFGRSRAPNPVIATAMHAVNAIVPLCKADPGVKTVLDLPMIMGTHASEKP